MPLQTWFYMGCIYNYAGETCVAIPGILLTISLCILCYSLNVVGMSGVKQLLNVSLKSIYVSLPACPGEWDWIYSFVCDVVSDVLWKLALCMK